MAGAGLTVEEISARTVLTRANVRKILRTAGVSDTQLERMVQR
jgi:hypothetical protein